MALSTHVHYPLFSFIYLSRMMYQICSFFFFFSSPFLPTNVSFSQFDAVRVSDSDRLVRSDTKRGGIRKLFLLYGKDR